MTWSSRHLVLDFDVPGYVLAFGVCPSGQPRGAALAGYDAIAAAGGTGSAIQVDDAVAIAGHDPAEPYASGEHLRDAFLAVNKAKDPSPYDAPNPCVRYAGDAPVVFCTPNDGAHGWPGYGTASIKTFFASAEQ